MAVRLEGLAVEHPVDEMPLGRIATVAGESAIFMAIVVRPFFFAERLDSKPAVQGTQKVLEYLGRYLYRIAITNSRILSIEEGKVTFRYRDSRTVEIKTMTLDANEFIRRFLQNVLPSGLHKVRYYGLWSPSYRDHLHKWQDVLDNPTDDERPPSCLDPATENSPSPQVQPCPYCKTGTLIHIKRLPPQGRAPP